MDNKQVIIYLTILGLPIDKEINEELIHANYIQLAKGYHPDSGSSVFSNGEQFKKLKEAYDYLKANIPYVNQCIRNGFVEIGKDSSPNGNSNSYSDFEKKEQMLLTKIKGLKDIKARYECRTYSEKSNWYMNNNLTLTFGIRSDWIYRIEKSIDKTKYSWKKYVHALSIIPEIHRRMVSDAAANNKFLNNSFTNRFDFALNLKNYASYIFSYSTVEGIESMIKEDAKQLNRTIKYNCQKPFNYVDYYTYINYLHLFIED